MEIAKIAKLPSYNIAIHYSEECCSITYLSYMCAVNICKADYMHTKNQRGFTSAYMCHVFQCIRSGGNQSKRYIIQVPLIELINNSIDEMVYPVCCIKLIENSGNVLIRAHGSRFSLSIHP